MNIFEALEKGNGKATLPNMTDFYIFQSKSDYCIRWNDQPPFKALNEDLKRNDWMPYVPRGTETKTEIHTNTMVIQNMDGGWFMIHCIGNTKAKLPVKVTLEWKE